MMIKIFFQRQQVVKLVFFDAADFPDRIQHVFVGLVEKKEIVYEMGDLWYHCLVLLAYHNITPEELFNELMKRRKGGSYHKFTGKTGVRPDM